MSSRDEYLLRPYKGVPVSVRLLYLLYWTSIRCGPMGGCRTLPSPEPRPSEPNPDLTLTSLTMHHNSLLESN